MAVAHGAGTKVRAMGVIRNIKKISQLVGNSGRTGLPDNFQHPPDNLPRVIYRGNFGRTGPSSGDDKFGLTNPLTTSHDPPPLATPQGVTASRGVHDIWSSAVIIVTGQLLPRKGSKRKRRISPSLHKTGIRAHTKPLGPFVVWNLPVRVPSFPVTPFRVRCATCWVEKYV